VFTGSREGNGPRFGDDGFSVTCIGLWALGMRMFSLLWSLQYVVLSIDGTFSGLLCLTIEKRVHTLVH
jgi:hypothetical protein